MRFGVRLGIDPGEARIGVARSDPSGILASPVETVRRGKGDLARIAELAEESESIEIVVGLPRTLRGTEGQSAARVRRWAAELTRRVAQPIRMCDERLTTVAAESMLAERGRSGQQRRAVVDQAAAVMILQHALDTERTTGAPPGELLGELLEKSTERVTKATRTEDDDE
ncbi:MAG: Holliday junction resolvase RuvX [Nocardioides sp.]